MMLFINNVEERVLIRALNGAYRALTFDEFKIEKSDNTPATKEIFNRIANDERFIIEKILNKLEKKK